MEQLTLEQAAKSYIDGYVNSGPPVHDSYIDALDKSFQAGAEWQKKQYAIVKQLTNAVLYCLSNAPEREYETNCLNKILELLQD